MQRACMLLKIKPDLVEEYKQAHQVWPEMKQAIKDAGIRNYSLFLREDGLLIGYFESEDPQESLRKLGDMEVNRLWQEDMAAYFETGSGDMGTDSVQWPEQVFHLE